MTMTNTLAYYGKEHLYCGPKNDIKKKNFSTLTISK